MTMSTKDNNCKLTIDEVKVINTLLLNEINKNKKMIEDVETLISGLGEDSCVSDDDTKSAAIKMVKAQSKVVEKYSRIYKKMMIMCYNAEKRIREGSSAEKF